MASTASLPDEFDSESLADKYHADDVLEDTPDDFPVVPNIIVDAIMHLDGKMGVYETIAGLSALLRVVDERDGMRTSVEVTERSEIDDTIVGWKVHRRPIKESETEEGKEELNKFSPHHPDSAQ